MRSDTIAFIIIEKKKKKKVVKLLVVVIHSILLMCGGQDGEVTVGSAAAAFAVDLFFDQVIFILIFSWIDL